MSYQRTSSLVLFTVMACAALWGTSPAQPVTSAPASRPSLTREEALYELEARDAQLALDLAKTEMQQAKVERDQVEKLFDEKLLTIEELNKAIQEHQQTVVRYKQAEGELAKKRLEFLKDATLITLVDAKKSRREGEVIASITLRNDSDIGRARIAMQGVEGITQQRLESLLKVDNVIVTLKGEAETVTAVAPGQRRYSTGKAIVGDPFQQIIPELKYGQLVVLTYRMLKKDVENVTVSLEFLGVEKDYDVFLTHEGQEDLPTIASTQYSQMGQLGTRILYDLNLERLAKTEQSFSLVVLNFPPEIPVSFLDPQSKAILTQVKFTNELSKQSLYCEVSIPERLTTELVDANLSFYILVTRPSELKEINELRKKHENRVPPDEIAKIKANAVELILIPRGVGKLEIVIPNAFKEVEQGQPVTIKFNVWNSGTLALRRVKPELSLPIEWEGRLLPEEAAIIDGGQKVMFTADVVPPQDVAVGEYAIKMEVEGYSGRETVNAIDKNFTVSIVSQSSITGTVVLVGVLVVLVVGIAIASIKISRR